MKSVENHAEKIECILSSRHLYLQMGKSLKKELTKAIIIKYSTIKIFHSLVNPKRTLAPKLLCLEKHAYQEGEEKTIQNTRCCCDNQSFRFNHLEKLLSENQFHIHKCRHLKCISIQVQLQMLNDFMEKHKHPYNLFTAKKLDLHKK